MSSPSQKGERGFDLDIHLTFKTPQSEAETLRSLQPFQHMRIDLYRPHPRATALEREVPDLVPSARLIGALGEPQGIRDNLATLLAGPVRSLEVGLRGYLRSADGATEWMPWKRNVIVAASDINAVTFEPGIRYVLEER